MIYLIEVLPDSREPVMVALVGKTMDGAVADALHHALKKDEPGEAGWAACIDETLSPDDRDRALHGFLDAYRVTHPEKVSNVTE